jgi:hypothetical protein
MKIFKFRQVDAKTGISVAIERPREGPTNPSLPGLEEIFDFNNHKYAEVDDTAEADPENYIFEITEEELNADIEAKTNQYLEMWKKDIYENEKGLRHQLFGKYDDTATSSGIYKYQEALNYLNDGTPSSVITAEATVRGVTETEIAERIIANHEAFRVKEAQLAGLRGKILDRLEGFEFDATDALGSWKELVERQEVVGQREPGNATGVQEDLDVKVGYYSPDLNVRWEYLNK